MEFEKLFGSSLFSGGAVTSAPAAETPAAPEPEKKDLDDPFKDIIKLFEKQQ